MKSSQILSVGIAAVALVQAASAADTVLHITGSTAFRSATSNAILNSMTFPSAGMGYAYNGTNFSGATYQIFKGSISGITGTVTVKTDWSGSVQGIQDVSQGNNIPFLVDTTTVSAGGTASAPVVTANELAEVAMADNNQGSTPYKTPLLNIATKVGIIPFAFIANQNVPASLTNMTNQLAKALYGSGFIATSLFTGNPADTTPIYLMGRDPGSGTRLVTLAEPGYGTQTPVTQFMPTAQTGNVLNNINITANGGNDGASSGGTVAGYCRLNSASVADDFNGNPATTIGIIGYMGENDTYNAVFGIGASVNGSGAANARYLSYNGVSAFGGVASKPATVATTINSNVVTLPAGGTAGIIPGQIIFGSGIAGGSTVVSVNAAANQLTLDKNATATGSATNAQVGAMLPQVIRNGTYSYWNYEYMLWKSSVIGTSGDKFNAGTTIKNRIITVDYAFGGLADDSSFQVFRDSDGGAIQHK